MNIRITILTVALFAFTGMLNHAQAQNPVSFGIKGGMNVASLSGGEYSEADNRIGLTAGASIDINFPMVPLGIESGVYYSQKGSVYEDALIEEELRLDYVEIPVMAKLRVGPPAPVRLHFLMGPYVGIPVNAEYTEETSAGSATVDLSDEVHDVDYGLMGGVGLDLSLGLTSFNIQARYSHGFMNVFENANAKNRVFSLVAGIRF